MTVTKSKHQQPNDYYIHRWLPLLSVSWFTKNSIVVCFLWLSSMSRMNSADERPGAYRMLQGRAEAREFLHHGSGSHSLIWWDTLILTSIHEGVIAFEIFLGYKNFIISDRTCQHLVRDHFTWSVEAFKILIEIIAFKISFSYENFVSRKKVCCAWSDCREFQLAPAVFLDSLKILVHRHLSYYKRKKKERKQIQLVKMHKKLNITRYTINIFMQYKLKATFHTLHCDGANWTRGLLDRTCSRAASGVMFLCSTWNFSIIMYADQILKGKSECHD